MQPVSIEALLDPETRDFYCHALGILQRSQVPFLIGGAYAFERHTGIARQTKDLDIFARPDDFPRILDTFAQAGYETELTVPHWLAKVYCGNNFVDIIFNSAHGCLPVTDSWFEHAIQDEVLGMSAQVCAPEEMIQSKAYIMARDRFDGADIAHLIRTCGQQLDWPRLLAQFGEGWRVLFSHLVLFGFIYPGEQSCIPNWVMHQLSQRLEQELKQSPANQKLCQGTLLAPLQYRIDVEKWGYADARLVPHGQLTQIDVDEWIDHLKQESNPDKQCDI